MAAPTAVMIIGCISVLRGVRSVALCRSLGRVKETGSAGEGREDVGVGWWRVMERREVC